MYAAKTTKAVNGDAYAFEVGKFNSSIVADHHVFNVTAAIDEHSDLPAYFVRQFRDLACKLRRQNLVRNYPPCVKLFYPAKLIRLEACGVSDYVLDSSFLPSTLDFEARTDGKVPETVKVQGWFELKLQEE